MAPFGKQNQLVQTKEKRAKSFYKKGELMIWRIKR
jgi:hypothetical protein